MRFGWLVGSLVLFSAAAFAQSDGGNGKFLREIRIDVPVPPDAAPAIGAMPDVPKLEAADSPLTMAPGAPWTVCITPAAASDA